MIDMVLSNNTDDTDVQPAKKKHGHYEETWIL